MSFSLGLNNEHWGLLQYVHVVVTNASDSTSGAFSVARVR